MAKNAFSEKKFFKLEATGTHKNRALDQLETWSNIPAHRWIPIQSLQITSHGYLSTRQAEWITTQLKKLQITVKFTEAKS